MLDAKAFGAELAEMVKGCLSPVIDRLAALEKRLDEQAPPPVVDEAAIARRAAEEVRAEVAALSDAVARIPAAPELPDIPAMVSGAVVDAVAAIPQPELPDVSAMVQQAVEDAVKAIPVPQDGKDADPEAVRAMVSDAVAGAVKAIPVPELPDVSGIVQRAVDEAVKSIPIPQDGKDGASVTADDVLPILEKQVSDFLAAVPLPKDGTDGKDGASVSADDVLPVLQKHVDDFLSAIPAPKDGADGRDGKDGDPGEKGADGIGLAVALIDRDGNLVVTLTNGETKALGAVVGKDGDPGEKGADGIGFDDMTLDYDGERTLTFLFQKGERIEERRFTVPVVLDRGVYRPDGVYDKGDAVTYGGSLWIAQRETKARPDSSADWRLSVKAGRNGRDSEAKAAAPSKPLRIGGGNAG